MIAEEIKKPYVSLKNKKISNIAKIKLKDI